MYREPDPEPRARAGPALGLKPFVDHRHARVGLAAVIQGIMGVAGCAQHAGAGED